MPNYPTLRSNEIFSGLYNQIISQQVFADNIQNHFSALLDENRVEGTLYGDAKTYFGTDVLKSYEWQADEEAANLLALHRPQGPETQVIYLDKFRYIPLTVDRYLSKRAWMGENAFQEFYSVSTTWINETQTVYEVTYYNAFVGTDVTTEGLQSQTVTLDAGTDEAGRRLRAQQIAKKIADLLISLSDCSRDFNDWGNLRAYAPENLRFVWNANYINEITKLDLPTMFHNDGLIDNLTKFKMPARYFGTVKTEEGTASASNTTIRSLVEKDYNTVAPNVSTYNEKLHIFPGDLIPASKKYNANEAYEEDPKVICKIMYKGSVPFMTSMQVATDFFNQLSLTETFFNVWGYNTLQHLKNYPFITLKEA